MKSLRKIPKILKINSIEGYLVSVLFNNGESRVVNFRDLFKNVFHLKPGQTGYELLENERLFSEIKIIGTTVGWETIGIEAEDEDGNKIFYPYDLDPLVLFQNSEPDFSWGKFIGQMIKKARKEAGLTQDELAQKAGTSKHYISRLENNKSDIELLTLKKIVEAGLGKRLQIEIT